MTTIESTPIDQGQPFPEQDAYQMTQKEKRFIGTQIFIAVAALMVGSSMGPLQAFNFAGLDIYPAIEPLIKSYYQGLTIHGVLNALVWTTFFITGFSGFAMMKGLKRPLSHPKLNNIGLVVMVVGLLTAAVPILLNLATVLFTFYAPLKAHWSFYVGLTLVVVGSWVQGWGFFLTFAKWRKENPGVRSPFVALGTVINFAMWQICTLGLAVSMLTMLIPWSMGLIDNVDPELSRTYFWFTGHPLVYFWLLPAYISWYGMLPKQAGGKLFSDSLARLTFWLFLIVSTPVGFHHQFVDPGVPQTWKWIHSLLTYAVFLPSMLTLFTVVASLEYAAHKRGGKGLLGWIRALPWGDASVASQLLAGILFLFGGIGGLTNASYNLNLIVHNTAWVPGHFHLTVASAVTMSFMGITYWMVPHLSGTKLASNRLALIQAWTWFVGMIIFSNAMHMLGLLGAPRRTPLGNAPYVPEEWGGHTFRASVGGAILLVSAVLYGVIMWRTWRAKKADPAEVPQTPIAEALRSPQLTPLWLDRFKPWLVFAALLLVVAYGPQLIDQVLNMNLNAPGAPTRPW